MVCELYLSKADVHNIHFRNPEESLKRQNLCSKTRTVLLEIYMTAMFIKMLKTEKTGFRYEPQKIISANISACWR